MAKFVVDSMENGMVTLRTPSMNYRNSFAMKGDGVGLKVGERVQGKILAIAWKVDRVELGGNYVEPLFGRPRRMQGTILAVDAQKNELTVQVGYEVTVKLPAKYKAADYHMGDRVGWDNEEVPLLKLTED
ncbi:MAG: hypothetical protein FWD61_05465 [Phycisphaerales bacterium]|nr:hypothetical protein [Phycisphaerales bacterium]